MSEIAIPMGGKGGSKKPGRVLSWISNTVFILVLAACVFLGFSIRANQNGMMGPSLLGLRAFQALSDSMAPTITTGGLIVVGERAAEEVNVGDILTFRAMNSPDTIVTHRVVRVEESGGERMFITQGDNNGTEDANPVSADRVVGVVLFWINGYDQMSSPAGIAVILVLLVMVLFVVPWLVRMLIKTVKQAA